MSAVPWENICSVPEIWKNMVWNMEWVSITHTGSQARVLITTAPLFVKTVLPPTALIHSRYAHSSVESLQSLSRNYSRLDDMCVFSCYLCPTGNSNKAVIKCDPGSQLLFFPYVVLIPVLQKVMKNPAPASNGRRKYILVCSFSWEYQHRWWVYRVKVCLKRKALGQKWI